MEFLCRQTANCFQPQSTHRIGKFIECTLQMPESRNLLERRPHKQSSYCHWKVLMNQVRWTRCLEKPEPNLIKNALHQSSATQQGKRQLTMRPQMKMQRCHRILFGH